MIPAITALIVYTCRCKVSVVVAAAVAVFFVCKMQTSCGDHVTLQRKQNANSIWCSQAVTHPSTNRARRCLTSVIGREPVYSTWYGRRRWNEKILQSYTLAKF